MDPVKPLSRVSWFDNEKKSLLVKIEPDETLKKLANEACDIQNACNTIGLSQRFAEVTKLLHRHEFCFGTDWVSQNPIVRAWLDKFVSLARMEQGLHLDDYMDFQTQCTKLANGETIEFQVWPIGLENWRSQDIPVHAPA